MKHYIAYHSAQKMESRYHEDAERSTGMFSFFSHKETKLRAAIATPSKAWIVEGFSEQNATQYLLHEVGRPQAVKPEDDTFIVSGPILHTFRPALRIDGFPWFKVLRAEQGNFAFGFNEIKDENVIGNLLDLESTWGAALSRTGSDISELGNPTDAQDARRRAWASIVRRQGQPDFRRALLDSYGGRCAMSDWDVPEALEAAHIRPYLGAHSNRVSNGLLLRADLHNLFDLALITIDPVALTILIDPTLKSTQLRMLANRPLRVPADTALHPSREAIAAHFAIFSERQHKGANSA